MAEDTTPLVSYDELVGAKDLASLRSLYRERGAEGSDEQVLERCQRDWYRLALARAKEQTTDPERFEPDQGELEGVRHDVYGLWHGMVGGSEQDYFDFVNDAIKELDLVLFENGLGMSYSSKRSAWIPDFVVLGFLRSVFLGVHVGVAFPAFAWELVRELLRFGGRKKEGEVESFDMTVRYHALDLETRRGVEEHPPLPSHLQIEYELDMLAKTPLRARWRDPFAIVPRSMFMAGFMVGYAKSRELDSLATVVGDLHTAEILHFLREPPTDHPAYLAGLRWGAKSDARRRFDMLGAKVFHLGTSGGVGSVLMLTIFGGGFLALRALYQALVAG